MTTDEAREVLLEREAIMGIIERDGQLVLASDSPYATVAEAQDAAYQAAKTIWESEKCMSKGSIRN